MNKFLPQLAIALVILALALFAPLPETLGIAVKVLAVALSAILAAGLWKDCCKPADEPAKPAEEPSKPAASADTKGSAEAEVITFLARLQEKGRLIDFLMDDIAGADDAAIGAAARVVYQGCKGVLDEHLKIEAIESGNEGGKVAIPEGYEASLYRLTGNLSGNAPFNGTLVHKGWKVTSAKLPKVIAAEGDALPPLAPAQVEV